MKRIVCVNIILLTLMGWVYSQDTPTTTPILSGPFTMSPGRVVKFSPGNLQYNAKQDVWRFAPHQYEIIGKGNRMIASDYDGWIDLFGWATAKEPTKWGKLEQYAPEVTTDNFPNTLDWGRHEINGYAPLVWRTPTSDEWDYLFSSRKNAKDLTTVATVEGINGVVILPDNWNHKWDKEDFTYPLLFDLPGFSDYNSFTQEQWAKFEARGAIFLPCTGFREEKQEKRVNSDGCYWSSTGFRNGSAYSLTFGGDYIFPQRDFGRYKARAVRLIHVIKNM